MRHAAEQSLAAWPNFRSVAGSAEAATLRNESVNFVTAAQAHIGSTARRRDTSSPEFEAGWMAISGLE